VKKTKNTLLEKLDEKLNSFKKYEIDKALNEIFAFIDNCNSIFKQETLGNSR
jgi:methionyl-tRNA synthetase